MASRCPSAASRAPSRPELRDQRLIARVQNLGQMRGALARLALPYPAGLDYGDLQPSSGEKQRRRHARDAAPHHRHVDLHVAGERGAEWAGAASDHNTL